MLQPSYSLFSQVSAFLLAGAFHTVIDFMIYNRLTRAPLCLTRVKANCVSTTTAMAISFTINHNVVFHPEHGDAAVRIFRFFLVTLFSSYLLQNAIIRLLSDVWMMPARSAIWVSKQIPATSRFTDEFIQKNVAKAVAVATGIIWNFLWYRLYVFAG
jgi:putative flippase GtrA